MESSQTEYHIKSNSVSEINNIYICYKYDDWISFFHSLNKQTYHVSSVAASTSSKGKLSPISYTSLSHSRTPTDF